MDKLETSKTSKQLYCGASGKVLVSQNGQGGLTLQGDERALGSGVD